MYADCHGLNKAIYQRRLKTKKHWGELDSDKEEIHESENDESSGLEDQESSEEELVDDDISSLNQNDY